MPRYHAAVLGCLLAVAVPATAIAASATHGGSYSNQKTLDFATVSTSGKVVVTGTFTNAKTLKWVAKITVGTCNSTVTSTLTLG